jgi:hypothetical protein
MKSFCGFLSYMIHIIAGAIEHRNASLNKKMGIGTAPYF